MGYHLLNVCEWVGMDWDGICEQRTSMLILHLLGGQKLMK